jgi:uncharacterized protein YggE
MEQSPDVIVITVSHEEDVVADRAELLVTVQGSSLVTGRAALQKAKEVREILAELDKCGITQEDIGLESVHAQISSGVLGKSSSATYRLLVRCRDLERLPDALGAITSARNATLESVRWRYPDSLEQELRWLEICIAQAHFKAQAAAKALGVRLVGVHRLEEQYLDMRHGVLSSGARGERDALVRRARVDLGFELSHQKRSGLKVTVEYLVEGFDPPKD